ncbi:centromere protein C isoform X3 [Brachypodium distachyon]|uniref:CENP-C n=1 Tax=Brachypodium distachyon TaxID=15368 RepID=A0A0Q3KCQ8_BRADI|nr:centromere protein C isoform X3 [Brachypodium distachyon]KQK08745.1 hypothetical protein BRADI_2g43660v3 [Brachypodium distachyon]|eukprot:XP_003566889.1 centromere protein C isoform X3 [Brachypodium distachyon]
MASVDAAGDPLRAVASATCLLFQTLSPAAFAQSSSMAREALLGGSLVQKGSKELMEQASLTLKQRGDIEKLYQEDHVEVAATGNDKKNQQGRRPGLDRKRARFTLKAPPSKTVQNVDFSQLLNIEDPEEYFSTLEQLERADKEIKRLRGEVPTKAADYHRAIEPPKKRPGMARRKSVFSYKFSVDADTPDVIEEPASQIETITEPQFTQDDMAPSVPERTELPVPSSSSQCDIPDVSMREDSFAEKDKCATLDSLLSAFKNLDESEEENLLREKLQLKEISIGKVCLPDLFNVPGDRPVSSTTMQKNLASGQAPEISVQGSHHARISQWEKDILGGDILNNESYLSEDDDSDDSPETVMGKRSPVHSSYNEVVLTGGEASTARVVKSPDHVLEPALNLSNDVSDKSEPESSSRGAHIDNEVHKEKDASSRHNISLEEGVVPINHPITEKPNHGTEVSSPRPLEGDSAEVPGSSTPGRNASALHEEDDNCEHQGVVGGDGLLQDQSIHPTPEKTAEDNDSHNQSNIQDGNIKNQAADINNELSLSKDGKQNAVRKGKNRKQPSKRGKRVAEEARHSSDPETQPMEDQILEEVIGANGNIQGAGIHTSEIPLGDIDPQNQSHMDHIIFEKSAVDISNKLSLSKGSKQKEIQNGKMKKQPPSKRGKHAADAPIHTSETPLGDIDPQNQSHMVHINFEKSAIDISKELSPRKDSKRSTVRNGKTKKQPPLKRGKTTPDKASNELGRTPEYFDPEIQPPNDQHTDVTRDPRSPKKGKGQKEARRRSKTQELNGRKSLSAFGLAWESGVRRSSRIRSRPLQDWLGERFLYGRIHGTMSTVIGVKSYSPSHDGKAALRVKSFVPDQYSDVVAEAGKY